MGLIQVLLALLIPAIAPVAGYVIGKFTKEELNAGKKYFVAMQNVLFVAVAAIFLYSGRWNLWVMIPGLAVLFAYLVFKKFRNPFIMEAIFGIIFSFAVRTSYLFILSALIFLYGLPTGSLFARQKKGLWKAVGAGLLFAVVAYGISYFL